MWTKLIRFSLGLLFFAAMGRSESLIFPSYQISIEFSDPKVTTFVLNRNQTLLVTLKPQSSTPSNVIDFKFDARMPQHKHGMVTNAKVTKIGTLQYRVEGVRLHMPGDWLLEFIVTDPKGSTRIEVPWNLANS